MKTKDEFRKYAVGHLGISSLNLEKYQSLYNYYVSPTIIEERQLNVAQMDVFSRLMMDRIIFLGTPIDDDVANSLNRPIPRKTLSFISTLPEGWFIQD